MLKRIVKIKCASKKICKISQEKANEEEKKTNEKVKKKKLKIWKRFTRSYVDFGFGSGSGVVPDVHVGASRKEEHGFCE